MLTVTEAWARIDKWLEKHSPATAALLAPPADPAEITAAEETLGLKFPPDLAESLLCHNGIGRESKPLPVHMPLLSVDEIVETWEMNVEVQEDLEQDEDDEPWWHRQWIPFEGIDSDSHFIDARPGEGGLGVHHHDEGGRLGGWASLRGYLSGTAEALHAGGEIDGKVAYLNERGELMWCAEHLAPKWGDLTRAPQF